MGTNYRTNSGVRFQMLSDDQLQELCDGVLHVLESIGLELKHERTKEVLKEVGAWVDGDRVRLSSYLARI
jgi:trimethylamine:corrinoid methyltransferase-like protein